MHFRGFFSLTRTQLHSERTKLYISLAFLSAKGIKEKQLCFKGRFLLFQVYLYFANLFSKLSVSTFYKEISKFQQKDRVKIIRLAILRGIP